MDSQDVINIRRKAKSETEAFINRHLNDGAKGWPKLCPGRSAYASLRQAQQTIRRTR
jgi:hypothetical protein